MKIPAINIIIAAGGTGGHLFPGIAIAQAFSKKNSDLIKKNGRKKIDFFVNLYRGGVQVNMYRGCTGPEGSF